MSTAWGLRAHELAATCTVVLVGLVTLVWPAARKAGLVARAEASPELSEIASVDEDGGVGGELPEVEAAAADPAPAPVALPTPEPVRPRTAPAPRAWDATTGRSYVADRAAPDALPYDLEARIVARAREEVTRGVGYANGYLRVSGYPGGDIPRDRGACTDVVVRSLRAADMDLQELVHEDILASPSSYEVGVVDVNIDHRRISTMHAYFAKNALSLSTDVRDVETFRPGDIVFFSWARCAPPSCKLDHVGVVSDRVGPRGLPLVLENGGPRAAENDSLDRGTLVAHFRAVSRY